MKNDDEIIVNLRSKYDTMVELNRNIYSPIRILGGMIINSISTTNNNYTYITRKEEKENEARRFY